MEEKKNCKIVQDLLPNYIENLTNEETKNYIEEHIKNCEECSTILKNMKEHIQTSSSRANKKEINYMRKFNAKLKILKIIILIIIAILLICIGRKSIIMSNLSKKYEENSNAKNYHIKTYIYSGTNSQVVDTYCKDGKTLTILTSLNNENFSKIIEYSDNDKTNTYMESSNEKIAFLNSETKLKLFSNSNSIYENVKRYFVKNSILASIRSVKCNGIDCYYISNFQNNIIPNGDGDYGIYLDKKTGLPIRVLGGTVGSSAETNDTVIDYYYEFNTVKDEDIQEPDITEYRIDN